MKIVINPYGKQVDFGAAVFLMDDEIREQLHAVGYTDEQKYFDAYIEAHKHKYNEEWELAKPNPVW